MPPRSKRQIQAKLARSKRQHVRLPSPPPPPSQNLIRSDRTTRSQHPMVGSSCFPVPCFPLYTCEDCMSQIPDTPRDGLEICYESESGAGLGLKTTIAIPGAEYIIRYTGKKCYNSCAGPYVLEVLPGKLWLDGGSGGNLSRFINHSCTPNCELYIEPITKRAMIFAIAPILPGEELSIRYTIESKNLPFKCQGRCCLRL
jgi:hypothetical protein